MIGGIIQNAYGSGAYNYQMSFPETGQGRQNPVGAPLGINKSENTENLTEAEIRFKKRTGEIECQSCSSRTYVDGSDDPGVSFKAPGKISAAQSAQTVMSHEMEHVNNEKAKAQRENREVVSSVVTTTTDICPECGRGYTSGGLTTTTTRGKREEDPFKDALDKQNGLGANLDARA